MKKALGVTFSFIILLFLLFPFFFLKEYNRFQNHLKSYSSKQAIHLVFAGDDGYITPLLTAFTSLSLNTKTPLHIHLLTNGFSPKNQKLIENLDFKLKNIQITMTLVSNELFKAFPINNRWNQSIYYRYLIPTLLTNTNKALYLDGDILVFNDLSSFYHIDLNNKVIAGIQDYFEKKFLSRPLFQDLTLYINSGVLLIDIDKWKEKNISQKLFETTAQYQDKIQYFDQDVINLVLKKDILPVSFKYNALQGAYTPFNKTIYHYSGKQKPWKTKKLDYYEWYKYFDYMQMILNDENWPVQSYLLYLIRKMIYYPSFIFKPKQNEA